MSRDFRVWPIDITGRFDFSAMASVRFGIFMKQNQMGKAINCPGIPNSMERSASEKWEKLKRLVTKIHPL